MMSPHIPFFKLVVFLGLPPFGARSLVLALLFSFNFALLLESGTVVASSHDPCLGDGVNSEACICSGVSYALVPTAFDPNTGLALDGSDDGPHEDSVNDPPVFDPSTGIWTAVPSGSIAPWGTEPTELHPLSPAPPALPRFLMRDYDLIYVSNERYKEHCSYAYLQENMLRLWRFSVILGGIFATISLTMVGVVYMQESASGNDLSRVKSHLFRVLAGLVLLGMALVVWQFLSDTIVTHVDGWTWEYLRSG